jgi:hypothetical protein
LLLSTISSLYANVLIFNRRAANTTFKPILYG